MRRANQIYLTIRPEILSSWESNESSGSLLSRNVPGYELLTLIVQQIGGNSNLDFEIAQNDC